MNGASRRTWTPWEPLEDAWKRTAVPSSPGLYRIRRVGRDDLDYIGQTGMGTMTLRKRLAMLKGVFGSLMPYRDPHTAAPALWSLRQLGGEFEVSVAAVQGSTPWRKALEAVEIGLYRQEHLKSPTVNFGRMPKGFSMSSGNNAKLVAAGKRHRGGPTAIEDESHLPGLPPPGPLGGDPQAAEWCGHQWSTWKPVEAVANLSRAAGLYRLRDGAMKGLLYIGQGLVRARLQAHVAKTLRPDDEQGRVFAKRNRLECSFVLNPALLAHQRLELENDLIAAHVLATGEVPPAQFIG